MESDQQPPVDTSQRLRIRLVRYLLGEATPDDRVAVERRIADEPDLATTLRELGKWWHSETDTNRSSDAELAAVRSEKAMIMVKAGLRDKAVNLVGRVAPTRDSDVLTAPGKHRLGKQTFRSARQQADGFSGWTLRALGTVSTVITVALVIGFSQWGVRHTAGTTRVYATNVTQSASFMLSDGTHVMLSPGTTLRLTNFGTTKRTVVLDNGEGFFDVSQSSGVPFVVRSGHVETRVLGTSFLVRRSVSNGRVHVAVASGKVDVLGAALGDSPLMLTAGRIGDVTDSIAHVSTVGDDAPKMAWEDGKMVFRDTPVPQVLDALTRWYGYQFRCPDSTVTQLRVTVGMNMRSSSAALAMLEQILSVNLTVVGDTVTLTPHAARTEHTPPRIRTYDVWTPNREVGR